MDDATRDIQDERSPDSRSPDGPFPDPRSLDENTPTGLDEHAPSGVNVADVRIGARIGDDPAELAVIADAVVRGCCICHAEIKSLRKLIEAVQAHPDAKLAPPQEERGDEWEPPRPSDDNALTKLEIHKGTIFDGDYQALDVRVTLACSASFVGDAWFDGASFAGEARFDWASFAGELTFYWASFAQEAWFDRASFAATASFDWARFAQEASFDGASFAATASFNRASFAWAARFEGTGFAGLASFDRASFADWASFDRASFAAAASFNRISFAWAPWFVGARYAEEAQFDRASFAGMASFAGASFAGPVQFGGASFAGDIFGDFRRSFLRTAFFAEAAKGAQDRAVASRQKESGGVAEGNRGSAGRVLARIGQVPAGRVWRWYQRRAKRKFGWQTVRSLGQLAILSRVSVVAIIAVPIVVALWNTVRAVVEQFATGHAVPAIGPSIALSFFAAVSVTLGLMVYQVWGPEEVRKHDEDAFIDLAHRRYPEDAPDREDGLRRAIEHLEQIAKRRPDRHASFVTHHGDTIWVPPRDKIEWFEDAKPRPSGSGCLNQAADLPSRPIPSQDGPPLAPALYTKGQGSRGDVEASVSEDQSAVPIEPRFEGVPGAERRRIVIEEGARAEYWLKSREKIVAAWASFILYLIGVGFLLWILGIQIWNVSHAAGWLERAAGF